MTKEENNKTESENLTKKSKPKVSETKNKI